MSNMPVYDFRFDQPAPQSLQPAKQVFTGIQQQLIDDHPISIPELDHKVPLLIDSDKNMAPEEVREVIVNGFFALDEGFKNWLSGIRVPTKDSYKLVSTHVVAQDRSILAWAQEFTDGRVPLPIISIQRNSWTFNPTHFHPPYLPFIKQYTDRSMRRMRLIYRPIPFKVEYVCTIWAEYKQDIEYISIDIIKKCNPMAIFYVQDEFMSQTVRVFNNGVTNQSDIDIGPDRPKVMYEWSATLEYAICINEKIVPTILGRIISIKEAVTEEPYDVYRVSDY